MFTPVHLGHFSEIIPSLPAKSVDLVIADLHNLSSSSLEQAIANPKEFTEILWQNINHVRKNHTALLLLAPSPLDKTIMVNEPKLFKYELVWNKGVADRQPSNMVRTPSIIHESIFVFYEKAFNYKQGDKKSILNHTMTSENEHLRVLPINLLKNLIAMYSKQGDTVLDISMGLAQAGVSCKQLSRKYIGISERPLDLLVAKTRLNIKPIYFK